MNERGNKPEKKTPLTSTQFNEFLLFLIDLQQIKDLFPLQFLW